MSKVIHQSIEVKTDGRGRPLMLAWERREVVVREVLDCWEEAGLWWEGELPRRVYRLMGRDGVVYEVHHSDQSWRLYRLYD